MSWQDGGSPVVGHVEFSTSVNAVESETLRWYLEDYAEFTAEPAPAIARDAEAVLADVGRQLFTAVFVDSAATAVWSAARREPGGMRVEIDTDPTDTPGLPWELLRDPATDQPVVLTADQFVRTHTAPHGPARRPVPTGEPIRVLLIICRPGGAEDLPFRSIASRLVRGGLDRHPGLAVQVLRPPTFARLAEVLRRAMHDGQPFHVVHFDGHGAFLEPHLVTGEAPDASSAGRRGYLVFEEPAAPSNLRFVNGTALGELLAETGVPVLVLNACRSAYSEALATPDPDAGPDERAHVYGSLATEVAAQGVPGVVAMRYNVYVDTATRFVEVFYRLLAEGRSLGVAASTARTALAADDRRWIGATPVSLQDWFVPTVHEASELILRTPTAPTTTRSAAEEFDGVPGTPDTGFFGRDDALFAVDRAFDTCSVVLLHAGAGAGKTTTAAEFARWYATTGGLRDVDGDGDAVVWTSFETYSPLARALDDVGTALAPRLAVAGVDWATVTDVAERRRIVLRELTTTPLLWVWDNTEPVAGFPAGGPSAWTAEEQDELRDFLAEVRGTSARVLLTSRRDEGTWLTDLPERVGLAPLSMRERRQMTHALVRLILGDGAGTDRRAEIDWTALLRFTEGNPLTIRVTVRQALLGEHVGTTEDVEAFVARLHAGATRLEPAREVELGRSASLTASLTYGFATAFSEVEQAQLAMLHLFRGAVQAQVLAALGDPDKVGEHVVPVLSGVDLTAAHLLLRRAVELGLLTVRPSSYVIHPALPAFFADLHTRTTDDATRDQRAYVTAYAGLGRFYFDHTQQGAATVVLPVMRDEEANFLHALDLARTREMTDEALGCAQCIRELYKLTGRTTEWARVVAALEDDYVDPATGLPRPGREDRFTIISEYRAHLLQARRDWAGAATALMRLVSWNRVQAARPLSLPREQLDQDGHHRISALAASELTTANLLIEQQDAACRTHLLEADRLYRHLGDTAGEAIVASTLGNAHLVVPDLHDFEEAGRWHRRSLQLKPAHNRIGRSASLSSLARIAFNRYLEAQSADSATPERLKALLGEAAVGYQDSLTLLPADHHAFRGIAHGQLGLVYWYLGEPDQALEHYQQAIGHFDRCENAFDAGGTRSNIALLLRRRGEVTQALRYARVALADFERFGPSAAAEAARTRELIADIERDQDAS